MEIEDENVFEFRKKNSRYLKCANLLKQIWEKSQLIAQNLYLKYLLLFLFDNATNYSMY